MKSIELPRGPALQATLRVTTQRLAAELATPTALAPAWNDVTWRVAMAVAVMHGVSGLLATRLQWRGPPAWQAFLAEQAEHGRRREARIRERLAVLHAAATAAGVPMLALKGASLLQTGLVRPGERPMSDIDLLVAPADVDAADRLIRAAGHAPGVRKHRHIAYEPLEQPAAPAFGEHEDNPIKIELHTAVAEPLPRREVDITASLPPHRPHAGLHGYASPGALMRHLLLHTTGNLCVRCVRLIQLHDIALLAQHLDDAGWAEALAPASDGRAAWWTVPTLTLVAQLFPGRLPALPPSALRACPPWLLRASRGWALTDVSLSHLCIPVLPGLAWARGPGDALGLAWQRLFPAERAVAAQIVQRQHSLAGSAWTRQPPWRKALSFLRGAPPRAQTMYSLHRALAYQPASSA